MHFSLGVWIYRFFLKNRQAISPAPATATPTKTYPSIDFDVFVGNVGMGGIGGCDMGTCISSSSPRCAREVATDDTTMIATIKINVINTTPFFTRNVSFMMWCADVFSQKKPLRAPEEE